MAGSKLSFDRKNFRFREAGGRLSRFLVTALQFVLSVLSLMVIAYALLSIFYSTEEEKALQAEIRANKELYPELSRKTAEIESGMASLSEKDDIIYKDIFRAEPPADDPMASLGIFFGSDSIPDTKLVFYTASKADRLLSDAAGVDSLFQAVVTHLKSSGKVLPPMELPLEGVSYTQIGAGIGPKINPFYTTVAEHNGIDIIAQQGADVFAPAAGVVRQVVRSRKADGNTVTITHKGGYVTRYAHLSDIFVSRGQSIRKGARIARVGMSGNSYAPHLHYEVRRDTVLLDPLNYFFASVTPEDYTNMVYMARHTKQSMD